MSKVLIEQSTINQAINDFDDIKHVIIDKGINVPNGTPTSEYKNKISEISSDYYTGWKPHPDWIMINQNVPLNSIVFLCTDSAGQGIVFQPTITPTSGTYTVVINNGTENIYTETFTNNVRFQYTFIQGEGKHCGDGYTTYKVTLTGNLSTFNNPTIGISQSILWSIINCPTITSLTQLYYRSGNVFSYLMECCEIMSCGDGAISGSGAFSYLTSLRKVTLPQNINNIGQNCFSNSIMLNELNIPESVTVIGSSSLNTTTLKNVTLPHNISTMGIGLFANNYVLRKVTIQSPVIISSLNQQFNNCHSLTEIVGSKFMQSTVELATSNAFSNLRSLKILDLSNMLLSAIALNGTATLLHSLENVYWHPDSTFSSTTAPQINISYCKFNAEALNDLFMRLPIVIGKTINIVGNIGSADCNADIATSKGWTVIQ